MAAAVTRRIKLATGITLVTERNPLILAKEIAVLDLHSQGRFLFGVGAGWNREETTLMTNIANILTLSRIAAIPLIAALLFFNEPLLRWIAFILFAVACITDFFDGYIARRMSAKTARR